MKPFAKITRHPQNLIGTLDAAGCFYKDKPFFKVESQKSSWAIPMLTKHRMVITVLEWPIKASSQGAACLPREPCQEGWRRQSRPSHLCPLGSVLTATLALGIPPKQGKEKTARHHSGSRSFLQGLRENRRMTWEVQKWQLFVAVCKQLAFKLGPISLI